MASCAWTSLCEYITAELEKKGATDYTIIPLSSAAELYDRVLNVFGWTTVRYQTQGLTSPWVQKLQYKLGVNHTRSPRFLRCCLIDKCKFPHDCSTFDKSFAQQGNFEAAIKMDKKLLVDFVRSLKRYYVPRAQGPPVSTTGDGQEQVDQAQNTALLTDLVEEKEAQRVAVEDWVLERSSTEKVYQFPEILDRWVPLDKIEVKAGMKGLLANYALPTALAKDSCVSNIFPFEQFAYGSYVFEVQVHCTSNPRQAGRAIIAVTPDPVGLSEEYYKDWPQLVTRQHAWIDFAVGSTATLEIPFEYHRSFVRNLDHGQNTAGVRGGISCRLDFAVVSPLVTGVGQQDTLTLLPFVRIKSAQFAGMAFKVDVKAQGPIIDKIRSYKAVIDQADKLLQVVGETTGLDKPLDPSSTMVVVPTPRMNFPVGKGVTDASVLKLSHFQTTTFPTRVKQQIRHNTVLDIAQQLGFLAAFDWKTQYAQGDLLKAIPIAPCDFGNPLSSPDSFPKWIPLPMSMIANMYQLWTGTINMSFVFPSTDQHKGKLLCTMEFTRTSADSDVCQAYAAYHVVFDLGENKRFDVAVPYIYDTPWRRCNNIPISSYFALPDVKNAKKYRTGLLQNINTRLTLKVVNPLRANNTVSNVIQCLIFCSAGQDMRFHGVTQFNQLLPNGTQPDQFPFDYDPAKRVRAVRSTDSNVRLKRLEHQGKTLGEVLMLQDKGLLKATEDDIQRYKEQIDQLAKELQVANATRQQISVKQQCTEEEITNREKVSILLDANYKWYQLNTTQRIGKGLTTQQMASVLTASNVPPSDVVVEGEFLVQQMLGGRELAFASEAWEVAASKGALIPVFKWETVQAQGEGDFSVQPVKFGPKLSIDPTLTLTPDVELSIWTLLKAPVQIKRQIVVNSLGDRCNAYFIPLIPPQWTYIQVDQDKEKVAVFDAMVAQSYHVALTSQFRFWRGSMRYTFVCYTAAPVMITYIPHSGTRLSGNRNLAPDDTTPFSQQTIGMSGNRTEILIPTVNQTAHVEVPYISENVWCTMNNGRVNDNWYWRDKGDDVAGHILLSCESEAKLDVWWSAGDDFRLSGYIGPLQCSRPRLADTLTDDHPRAQADFWTEDSKGLVPLPSCQFDCLSAVGTAFTTAFSALSISNAIGVRGFLADSKPLIGKTEEVLDALTTTLSQSQEVVDGVLNIENKIPEILESIAEKVVATFNKVTKLTLTTVTVVKSLLDIWVCWKLGDPLVLTTTIVRWLLDAGLIASHHLALGIQAFKDFFTRSEVRAQAGPQQLLSKIVELFCRAFGFWERFAGARIRSVINFICSFSKLKDFCYAVRNIQCLISFLEGLVDLVLDVWYYFVGYSDPEAKLAHALDSKNEILLNFVADAHFFLQPENRKLLKTSPRARLRFYAALQTSYLIKKLIIKQTTAKGQHITELVKLIDRLQKMHDELYEEITASPVRFEPFIVCLHGDSAIGKSYLSTDLVTNLLEDIDWPKDISPIFVRTPGREYWDGYNGQPVIIFDDIHNIDDTQANVAAIADIYALKSSAVFNPNMARLEEKNMKANPLLVILLTNNPFPQAPEINCTEAFYRRRDMVIKVDKVSENMDEEFSHLRFRPYKNAIPSASKPQGEIGGASYNYAEFKHLLKAKWVDYYQKEVENVTFRWKHFVRCLSKESEEVLLEYDPYMLLTKHLLHAEVRAGRSHTLAVDMQVAFNSFLEANGKADVLDVYESSFMEELLQEVQAPLQEEEEATPHAQMDMDEFAEAFSSFNPEFLSQLIREDVLRLHNSTFMGDRNTASSIPGVVIYETVYRYLARLASSAFLQRACEMVGVKVGVCSKCGCRGHIIVKECDGRHDPQCTAQWCAQCMLEGVAHASVYVYEVSKLQKFLYIIKQAIATIATITGVGVGFCLLAFLHIANAAFAVLKGLGYWCWLNSFFLLLTGNFSLSLSFFCVGTIYHYITGVFGHSLDYTSEMAGYIVGFCGMVKRCMSIWLGCGKKAIQGPAAGVQAPGEYVNLDHPEGFKEMVDKGYIGCNYYAPAFVDPRVLPTRTECDHVELVVADSVPTIELQEPLYSVQGVFDPEKGVWRSERFSKEYSSHPCGSHCIMLDNKVARAFGKAAGRKCEHQVMMLSRTQLNPTIEWKGDGKWLAIWGGHEYMLDNQPCNTILCPLRNFHVVRYLLTIAEDSLEYQITLDPNVAEDVVIRNRPYQMFLYKDLLKYHRPYYYKLYSFCEYLRKLVRNCKIQFVGIGSGLVKLASIVISVALLVGALCKLVKSLTKYFTGGGVEEVQAPFSWEEVRAEAGSKYDPGTPRRSKNPNRKGRGSRGSRKPRSQGQYENTMSVTARIMRNMIQLHLLGASGKMLRLNGLGLFGHVVLFPKHYAVLFQSLYGKQVNVSLVLQGDRVFPCMLQEQDFKLDEENDLMFWNSPPSLGIFADISKHFATDDFYDRAVIAGEGFLMIPPIREMPVPTIQGLHLSEIVERQNVVGLDGQTYQVLDCITYNFSMDGACGSPLLRLSPVQPLVGIHVAGSGDGIRGTGYAVIITQEMIEPYRVTPVSQFDIPALMCIDEGLTNFEETVNVIEIGSVPPEMAVIQPVKTKICESLIAQDLGVQPVRVPAPLGPREGIYADLETTPLVSGAAHHSCDVLDIGTEVENTVGELLVARYKGMRPTVVSPKKLTPEETVTGFKQVEYYDPMDLRTSPGYPYNKLRPGDKSEWVAVERDQDECPVAATIDPLVLQTIEEKEDLRKQGIVPYTVFADVLKDEKRKKDKLQKPGSTRIICMSPIDFTITIRMFFLHFMAAFMHNRLTKNHAIGISPDGPEWTRLVEKLRRVNSRFCWTLDYTNFGPGFSPRAGRAAFRVMCEWTKQHVKLNPGDEKQFAAIGYELLQSTHICNDLIYQQTCGSPSGAALTCVINSLVNEFYLLWALRALMQNFFKKLGKKIDMLEIQEIIDTHVAFITYGDDVIAATSDDYKDVLNAKTISDFFSQYNIVSTDSTKAKQVIPFGPYETTFSFLKRGIKRHPNGKDWLGPVERYVFEEAAYYSHRSGNAVENTIENVKASLLLAYGHGPEIFSEWSAIVNAALSKRGLPPVTYTWYDIDMLFFPKDTLRAQAMRTLRIGWRYEYVWVQDNIEDNNVAELMAWLIAQEDPDEIKCQVEKMLVGLRKNRFGQIKQFSEKQV